MLYFSDAAELNLIRMDAKMNILEFINKPNFRVSDTSLTYRQIHLLSKDGILDAQEDEGKWRKFSFNELIFLAVTQELKRNGFTNKQLLPLYKAFFKGEKDEGIPRMGGIVAEPRGLSAKAIGYAFLGIPIILKYSPDLGADFYDPVSINLYGGMGGKSFTCINLHEFVNELLGKLGTKGSIDYGPMFKVCSEVLLGGGSVSKEEKDVLEVMRSGDFEKIEVALKNGNVTTFRGTKRERGDLSPKDITDAIKAHDYQKVTIFVQGGKMVTCESEIVQKA
ncbi:MAG: hypothetical protein AAB473_01075 [Patescibacteria group bacterium]